MLDAASYLSSWRAWTGRALRIGVARDALALVRTSAWPHEPARLIEVRAGTGDGASALAGALDGLLVGGRARGWPVTLVLADDLARLWTVTPPAGATRLADLHGAAALRFSTLFGAGADAWKIDADWQAGRPFLAAALPRALLDALLQTLHAHRCTAIEVAPQFVAALNQHRAMRRPGAWFGLVHAGVLSLAAFDGKRLAAVRTAPVPAGADRDWLDGHVAREALRVGLPRPERLQISGAVPPGWASSAGRLKFACTVLEDTLDPLWPDAARLAMTGVRP